MNAPERRDALDANLPVRAFAMAVSNTELQRFPYASSQFEHLSAVVIRKLVTGNNVLLALSCREAGVVRVTDNHRDFERSARGASFDFVDSGPAPLR